jgi:hypothetical protein
VAKKIKSQKSVRSTDAPASYRGFSIQATRCLHHLMAPVPPEYVWLEVVDDVVVENKDGTRISEQDKSYTTSNPLSDRAVPLWKTLRNWVDTAMGGQINADITRFVIYAPSSTPGDFLQSIASAMDQAEVSDVIRRISEYAAETDAGDWIKHAKVVAAADPTILGKVIRQIGVDVPSGAPADTLPPLFSAKLISGDVLDDTVKWAHGWIKDTVDGLLHLSKPVCIHHASFHQALLAFVKSHDRLIVLRSYAGSPDSSDVNSHLAFRCYVRQLRIIELSEVEMLQAVNDYLRASIDRTEWARRGLVTESSLEDFEHELLMTWKNKQRKVLLTHVQSNAEQQGQLIYSDCMDHSLPLDGLATPPAFLRGSFHSIADDCTIGWHPNFATVLASTADTEAPP